MDYIIGYFTGLAVGMTCGWLWHMAYVSHKEPASHD